MFAHSTDSSPKSAEPWMLGDESGSMTL
jgi:hypothetical protein